MSITTETDRDTRVVITGVGLVTANGENTEQSWQSIVAGKSGIVHNTQFDTSQLLTPWAGMVTADQDPSVDRCYSLATQALREALDASGLILDAATSERVALIVASSLGAMPTLEKVQRAAVTSGAYDTEKALASQLHGVCDHLATAFDIRGPRVVTSNACAAGTVAVGYAAELLWHGDVDYVICGGVDPLAELSHYGFSCLGALDPDPCSPMTGSTGLTIGEGAGFLVLERAETAQDRGAASLGEVAGYGTALDGYHQTAPDPSGVGAASSMSAALVTADLSTADVDYINLHGTGTPTNDAVEPTAIKMLFGGVDLPPASSTKSALGHTLGAAGAIETVCSVLAINHKMLPPTINTKGRQASSGLDLVPEQGRSAAPKVVLSNSFAFGGNNASVVVTEAGYRPERRPVTHTNEVVITGLGGVAGSLAGAGAIGAALASGENALNGVHTLIDGTDVPIGRADTARLARRINPARARRMDPLAIMAAAAVNDLFDQYGKLSRGDAEKTGIVLGTGYGPLTAVTGFFDGVIREGIAGANALVFPNTVVNAAAGHLAMLNRFHGYTATLACGGTSAVLALQLATRVIGRGAAERIMVVVADEFPGCAVQVCGQIASYNRDGHPAPGNGWAIGDGSVAVLLESKAAALARGASTLAMLRGFGAGGEAAGPWGLSADGQSWARSMVGALAEASAQPGDIDLVVSAANGSSRADAAERRALHYAGLSATRVIVPKLQLGETQGSAAGLGLVAALADPANAGAKVLISSYANGGSYASMVVDL